MKAALLAALGVVWSLCAAGQGHDHETAPLRLHGPAQPGTGWVMTLQIGENRIYRFNNLTGPNTLDLGPLESGWNTFRFYNVERYVLKPDAAPQRGPTGLSCSGGFDAAAAAEWQIVMRTSGTTLQCELLPARYQ